MKKFYYHPILLAAICVGFIASLLIGMERHAVEEHSRTVELAIDYEGLLELAAREGLPADEVLARAKEAGITSLAVYETTFKKFNVNGKAVALTAVSSGRRSTSSGMTRRHSPSSRKISSAVLARRA